MQSRTFIANDAQTALAQVESQMGPDAVVMSVRRLPAAGLSRLWNGQQQIEVVAGVPDKPKRTAPVTEDTYVPFGDRVEPVIPQFARAGRAWRSIAWLESLGLLPELANQLEARVCAQYGNWPPPMPIEEWNIVKSTLAAFWRPAPRADEGSGRPHVFIGPPGSGKTTALCKWITRAALAEGRIIQACRLDGTSLNTSEFFSLHCEMIGVPVTRFWSPPEIPPDFIFVDLPGTDSNDSQAMAELRSQLNTLPSPHVHLVLNAAYESATLFEQARAFSVFAPESLVFTHLDEERHRVKLWNFVLGTNCSVSYLGAGQKIPGDFRPAASDLLFPR